MAPASEMNGISASSAAGMIDMVVPVVVPPMIARPRRPQPSGRRRFEPCQVAAIVVERQSDFLTDAARGVHLVDQHFQGLRLRVAEEGGGAGFGNCRADADFGARAEREAGGDQCGKGCRGQNLPCFSGLSLSRRSGGFRPSPHYPREAAADEGCVGQAGVAGWLAPVTW